MLLLVFWFQAGWSSSPFGSSFQNSSSTWSLLLTGYIHLGAWYAVLVVHFIPFQGTFGYLFLGILLPSPLLVPQVVDRACALFKDLYPFFKKMAIPFSNRTGVIIIPELALRDKPALLMAEIHQDLFKVIPREEFVKAVCCVQYMGRTHLHITFASPDRMEDILHRGISIRGHPVTMTPISTKKWVRVSRVPFGIPLASVQQALDPYGDYYITKRETLNNISTGEISVLMNIKSPIPSKLAIAGRPCIVWYQGQRQTCYLCNNEDHRANTCPKRRAKAVDGTSFASVTAGPKPKSPWTILATSGGSPQQDAPLPTTPARPLQQVVHTPAMPVGPTTLRLPESPELQASAEILQSKHNSTAEVEKSPAPKKARTSRPPDTPWPQSTQSPILESPILGCNAMSLSKDPTVSPDLLPPAPVEEAMEGVSTSKQPIQPTSKIPGPPKLTRKIQRRGTAKVKPSIEHAVIRKSTRPVPISGSSRKKIQESFCSQNRFSPLDIEAVTPQSEENVEFRVTASGNISAVTPPRPVRTIPNNPFPVSGSES